MKYTYQQLAESGNWAQPQPDDVGHAATLADLRWALDDWADTVEQFDERQVASLMVWASHLDDVTDQYPDFVLTIGPRGGIRREVC